MAIRHKTKWNLNLEIQYVIWCEQCMQTMHEQGVSVVGFVPSLGVSWKLLGC